MYAYIIYLCTCYIIDYIMNKYISYMYMGIMCLPITYLPQRPWWVGRNQLGEATGWLGI